MAPSPENIPRRDVPWARIAWFGGLLVAGFAPILWRLVAQWSTDDDMSHGFFVPLVAGYIIWQRREELLALESKPDWRGLTVVAWGALQLFIGSLAVELFLSRTAFPITLIGVIWTLCGAQVLRRMAFPLALCFLMVPIPAVVYSSITFPLQLLASRCAEHALDLLSIPVLREGNVLDLPNQQLSVVDACSGIRSLLSLTFLSLVYGYFFEKRAWMRIVLFLSTVPIAIVANAGRVTFTGIMTQVKPELAEGFFHSASGWVIFMVALLVLILFHQLLVRACQFFAGRRLRASAN